jgi:hypothetical protein
MMRMAGVRALRNQQHDAEGLVVDSLMGYGCWRISLQSE